ncbi:MAG: GNAT family N-acetyltransferase [Acidimicrobiia bacterium]
MPTELRPITGDEFDDLLGVLSTAFGEDSTPEASEYERRIFELDRSLAAFDGGDIVASAGAYSFELTLPGGVTAPAAGVTWVGVLPTHRRQGILRSMMAHQLADIADRGEALAVLEASEGAIYGRFGYGPASFSVAVDLATRAVRLRPEPGTGGRIRLLDDKAARQVLPQVCEATRRQRPGLIRRSDAYWESYFTDPKDWRGDASARRYAGHADAAGRPDGFVAYRVKETWSESDTLPGNTVIVTDTRAASPETDAALCAYLTEIDLVGKVSLRRRPVDDPLRFRLGDLHHYRVKRMGEGLWVRLVDVAGALALRRYARDETLVLSVRDRCLPANHGCYRLTAGPDGSSCDRVGDAADADLTIDVDALGAAYLGGVSFTVLGAAGRAVGEPAALRRADALFAATPLPFGDLSF